MNAAQAFLGSGMSRQDFDYLVGEAMEEAKGRERKQDREESEELMANAGIRQAFSEPDRPADEAEAFAEAVNEALSQPLPPGTQNDRAIYEKSIAARRAEKAKQQAIAAAAMAKARQLTASIRSMEDALDGLLVSEA